MEGDKTVDRVGNSDFREWLKATLAIFKLFYF